MYPVPNPLEVFTGLIVSVPVRVESIVPVFQPLAFSRFEFMVNNGTLATIPEP